MFSIFRPFVRFALVWFCLFPLPFCVWEGLRLVIVALPGLFYYFFCHALNERLRSSCVDAQTDLSLSWVHMSLCYSYIIHSHDV